LQAPLEYALSTNGGSGNCKHSMRESRPEAARYNHCRDFVAVSVERRLSSLLPRSIGRGRPSGKGRSRCCGCERVVPAASNLNVVAGSSRGCPWTKLRHFCPRPNPPYLSDATHVGSVRVGQTSGPATCEDERAQDVLTATLVRLRL
jgi:hypothetical protein